MVHLSLENSTLKSYLLFFPPRKSAPLIAFTFALLFSVYIPFNPHFQSVRVSSLWKTNSPVSLVFQQPASLDRGHSSAVYSFFFFFPSPSIDRGGKHEGRKDEEQKEVEGGDGNEPGEEDRIGFAPRKRNLPSVFHGQRGRFEGRVKIQGCCYIALDSWFLNVSWCCHLSIIIVNDVFKGLYLSFNNFFFFFSFLKYNIFIYVGKIFDEEILIEENNFDLNPFKTNFSILHSIFHTLRKIGPFQSVSETSI